MLLGTSHGQLAPDDPLSRTDPYTLYLNGDERPLPGYFSLAFVGGLPARTIPLGYNLSSIHSSFAQDFADGVAFPPAPFQPEDHLRYMSKELGGINLGIRMLSAAKKGALPLKTKKYGDMYPSLDASGEPYAHVLKIINVFDPATRRYLLDYARAHVREWGVDDPSGKTIIYWSMDNEWEGAPNYSPAARAAFANWLEEAYAGEVAALNDCWGEDYASFEAAANGDLPAPDEYRTRPAVFLDWYTFQSEAFTGFLSEIATAMYEEDPQRRPVIHKSTQQTIEMPTANRRFTFDPALFAEQMRTVGGGYFGIDIYGAGDRETYETNYAYQCIRPDGHSPGYGVVLCETNNHGGPGHQYAATFWRLLANGVKGLHNFTTGFAGAEGDFSKFGFLDAQTGMPRDKFFYAARLAHEIHRAEGFWTQSVPAASNKRVALLMPRRDVLLADSSQRNKHVSIWAYAENHRWLLFRRLREQGYWVDIIPYTKLNPDYLKGYEALFLIGAEHLSQPEQDVIEEYVAGGGTLVADERPGYYDEHHRVLNDLETVLGMSLGETENVSPVRFETGGIEISGKRSFSSQPVGAEPVAENADGVPLAYLHRYGEGTVLYFPCMLGTLEGDFSSVDGKSFVVEDGPTADGEEYRARTGEFALGDWLGDMLARAGLTPAVEVAGDHPETRGLLRLEQPVIDEQGNVAVVVSSRAASEHEVIAPCTVRLALPGGPWSVGLWSPAEHDGLEAVSLTALEDGRYEIALPEVQTAGVLYLFNHHSPLLGIAPVETARRSVDGHGPVVRPGETFDVCVQIFNTTGDEMPEGALRLVAPMEWHVGRSEVPTEALPAGASTSATFAVTPPGGDAALQPGFLYPLVARWSDGDEDRAVISTNVEAAPDPSAVPRLLTDNATYPDTYPYRTQTGATYRTLAPEDRGLYRDPAAPDENDPRGALLNGHGWWLGRMGLPVTRTVERKAYATYRSPETVLLFDLKGVRELSSVYVVTIPELGTPASISIETSQDGKVFEWQETADFSGRWQTARIELPVCRAQYVKMTIAWPSEKGGALDEVEIWGR
ncbi:MAG: beta-galactosidase [Verrucomicrobiota bacterium JB024]|nr:beta-galactosidase [Verrucomicrobiota bacterium JB024]